MPNKILNFLKAVFTILLLFIISFIPQPLHQQYEPAIIIFLSIFLLVLFLNKIYTENLINIQDWPVWLFLVCMASGLVSSVDKNSSITTYAYQTGIFFLLFYIGKTLFRFDKDWNRFSITLSLFSGCVAVIAILELYFGKNILYEHFIPNFCYERYIGPNARPMSTQLNPAILGTYLTCCLPFNFYQLKNKSILLQRWGLLSSLLSLVIIIWTFSRGVLLGLIALLLFYLWNIKKRRVILFFLICLFILITICSFSNNMNLYRFGFKGMIYGSYASIFSDYRFQRCLMALRMLKDHPWFGIGLNNFRIRFYDYYNGVKNSVPHEFMIADNMYLTILAETGIVGSISFLVFIISLLGKGLKQLSIKKGAEKLKLLIPFATLVGLLVNMGAYDLFFWSGPYMLFCLVCGFIQKSSQEPLNI